MIGFAGIRSVATATYPNGVQHSFTYDTLDRLSAKSVAKGSTLASYSYQRGVAGHIASATELSGRTASFAYDAAYRLLSETVSGDPGGRNGAVSYGLDAVGNRLSRSSTIAGIGAQSFTYNANDQVTGETFDANGNTTASGGKTYGYDFLNRLKTASGGVAIGYDGDDNRVSKTVGGVTTYYLVDEVNPTGLAQVVEEVSGGVVQRTYSYGLARIGQIAWSGAQSAASFYGYDGQEHVRLLTNAAGVVTDTYDYDAYGNLNASTGTTANAYLYRGERWDADLGLYYLRARYLNPVTGRFVTRDPLDAGLGDVGNQHRYLYAAGDPVNRMDPTGLLNTGEQTTLLAKVGLSVVGTGLLLREIYYYNNPQQNPEVQPVHPVMTNEPGWYAKCIGNLVASLIGQAAKGEKGANRRVSCHFEAKAVEDIALAQALAVASVKTSFVTGVIGMIVVGSRKYATRHDMT